MSLWGRLLFCLTMLLAFAAPARADDVAAASRSVVRVVVVQVEGDQITDFGHGSGFAVAPNRIVTNAHVVELATQNPNAVAIGIVPSEGTQSFEARVIAVDQRRDLALLEIQSGSVPAIPLFTGTVDGGSSVAALGYPGNVDLATAQSMRDYVTPLPPTRSMGNFSDVRQGDIGQLIVHTAAIARGNSGGPLVDLCGRVLGVNRMITRNDSGDSTFGFAIPVRTLIEFLGAARQPYGQVDGECVSLESRQRDEAQRTEDERQRAAAEEAARNRQMEEARNRALISIEETRETRLGIAVLLLVLAIGGGGAAGVLVVKNRNRPAIITGVVGGVLLIGAVVVFFTRPSLNNAEVDEAANAIAPANPNAFVGRNLCRLERARSRVTVSNEPEVRLSFASGGCVNGATQYAQDGDTWRRVMVPNQEQTVTVSTFNPTTGSYIVDRYLLGAQQMEQARQLRRRIEQRACTADPEARTILGDRQRDIVQALPANPNERLVYSCALDNGPAPIGNDVAPTER